jgi:hypothetical protein
MKHTTLNLVLTLVISLAGATVLAKQTVVQPALPLPTSIDELSQQEGTFYFLKENSSARLYRETLSKQENRGFLFVKNVDVGVTWSTMLLCVNDNIAIKIYKLTKEHVGTIYEGGLWAQKSICAAEKHKEKPRVDITVSDLRIRKK